MKNGKLPVLGLLVIALTVGVALAGGPVVWALIVMGVPVVVFVMVLGGGRPHADNGHFRQPDAKS